MLAGELHAIFLGMHPLGSIAPDQSGRIVTDGVHDLIATHDSADTVRGSAAPANRSDTTHHFTEPRPLTWSLPRRSRHQAAMMLVPKWCYTT